MNRVILGADTVVVVAACVVCSVVAECVVPTVVVVSVTVNYQLQIQT